eukprot:2278823-Rhodomonas_salina.3
MLAVHRCWTDTALFLQLKHVEPPEQALPRWPWRLYELEVSVLTAGNGAALESFSVLLILGGGEAMRWAESSS